MTISELCKIAHINSSSKDFWTDCDICKGGKSFYAYTKKTVCKNCTPSGKNKRNISELLMLIVTEIAEACEGLRHGNPASNHIPKFSLVEEELADAIIRIADLSEAYGYRIEKAILAKLKFNKTRPIKHGKKF